MINVKINCTITVMFTDKFTCILVNCLQFHSFWLTLHIYIDIITLIQIISLQNLIQSSRTNKDVS